ncbi:PAS domain S-box protein [Pelobium manganitolerans]|uniref:PAS domain S-box protein n=1 Tax=Pelobium manganitolerans TaxID=1842495 RepID=UPI003FA3BA8A
MHELNFLSSRGEMGQLIRDKDWSNNPLGKPEDWPQSLKTSLSIILNSKFPKFLFWGDELRCFYNDAYRSSLGVNGKHPHIIGEKGEVAWAEIWDIIKPMMDQVLQTGEATWSENQLIPFYRNGQIEDIYWTFSYSPIVDEDGKIAGIFTSCVETTKEVLARKELERLNQRFHNNIMHAPIAMCVLVGEDKVIDIANQRMLELWGKTAEEALYKPVFEALPEVKGQGLEAILDEVYTSGIKFEAKERLVTLPRDGKMEDFFIDFVYEPVKDVYSNQVNIVVTATDITSSVLARQKVQESESKLNVVLNASGLAVYEYEYKTQKVTFSEQYLSIFGLNRGENLTRAHILTMMHPDDKAQRDEAHREVFETGTLYYQSRIFKADGEVRWIEAMGKLSRDAEGNPEKILGTIKDITAEKSHQQALQQREQTFRLLANEMPQSVWTADASGRINYFNKAFYRFTGLNESILENDSWPLMVHPDDRENNVKTWNAAVRTGEDYLVEQRFRRYDGEYAWQLSRGKALKDVHGNITMWVGTSTNIQEIKALDEQKDYFISMASHELKTPITSIKGYTQLLSQKYKNSDDAFLNNALKVMHKQVETLTTLVVDLLDVSKIKTGSLQPRKAHFNLCNLINEVVAEITHIHPNNKINYVGQTGTLEIIADEEGIRQVLVNFLTNAVKYSPESLDVIIDLDVNDNEISVSVTDFGIGISHANQARIFERFFRVEGKNEKTFPGFGIGLYIAAEIIRKHNGNIGVRSEMGQGSTFYFTLPLL